MITFIIVIIYIVFCGDAFLRAFDDFIEGCATAGQPLKSSRGIRGLRRYRTSTAYLQSLGRGAARRKAFFTTQTDPTLEKLRGRAINRLTLVALVIPLFMTLAVLEVVVERQLGLIR